MDKKSTVGEKSAVEEKSTVGEKSARRTQGDRKIAITVVESSCGCGGDCDCP